MKLKKIVATVLTAAIVLGTMQNISFAAGNDYAGAEIVLEGSGFSRLEEDVENSRAHYSGKCIYEHTGTAENLIIPKQFVGDSQSVVSLGFSSFVSAAVKTITMPETVCSVTSKGLTDCFPSLTDLYIYNPNCALSLDDSEWQSGLTIHGIKGSTAEALAIDDNLTFEELPAESASSFTVSDGTLTAYTGDRICPVVPDGGEKNSQNRLQRKRKDIQCDLPRKR